MTLQQDKHAGGLGAKSLKQRDTRSGMQLATTFPFPANGEGEFMNWDRIEGNWKQLKGKAKQQWGKLTDDQLDVIAGNRDRLAGKIQEQYGISKDEAEKQLSAFETQYRDWNPPRS
jgi:uncharacterized protein YjbJ (UPF0337 family)